MLFSADVVNWVQRPSRTQTNYFKGVAYGNGQFVAVGYYVAPSVGGLAQTILTSSDGVTWVQRQSGMEGGLEVIGYGNGQFVAVDFVRGTLTSTDGVNWVQHQLAVPSDLNGVAYGSSQFVAVGAHGTIVTCNDGVNWIQRQSGAYSLSSIAYGNGQFVAVGGHNEDTGEIESTILTSTNWLLPYATPLR